MENIILNFNNQIMLNEFISFFSAEIVCIIGIILNMFFFLFFKRKLNTKRLSDFITNGALILNLIISSSIYFKNFFYNQDFNVSFLDGLFIIDKTSILIKISLNLLLLLFLFTHYQLNRKIKFKTPILNTILLLLSLMGSFLTSSMSFLLIFLFLDLSVFLIYKFASNMRIRKYQVYSKDFIFLSLCSSFLFYSFYILTLLIENNLQLNIIKVCLILSILLKIGLFPFYNYQLDKNYKTNLSYNALLFMYLPYIGICAFDKISLFLNINSDIIQIPISIFIGFSIITFSIFTLKQKNLIKLFANTNCIFNNLIILNIILFGSNIFNIKTAFNCAILFLGIYSLLAILKINFGVNKINLNSISCIFFNNRFYALILSILILMMSSVVYSDISKSFLQIVKNIYLFDISAYTAVILIVFAFMMILLSSLKVIQNIYHFDKMLLKNKFKKRTTINYVVPVFSILFLVVKIFL